MPAARTITLQSIAHKAGVSRATFSYVLRNDPNIPPVTRQRTQKIAKDLGYRPNLLLATRMSHLRTSRPIKDVEMLAYLTAYPTLNEWQKVSDFLVHPEDASERAVLLGYKREEFWPREPGMSGAPGPDFLVARHPRRADPPAAASAESFVIGIGGGSPPQPSVTRSGRPICIGRWIANSTAWHWHCGSWASAAFLRWFARHRPEAVISLGTEVVHWLGAEGWKIPEKVGVNISAPPEGSDLAGVHRNSRCVGAATVDLGVEQLHPNERGLPEIPEAVLVKNRWADGPLVRDLRDVHRRPRNPRTPRQETRRSTK